MATMQIESLLTGIRDTSGNPLDGGLVYTYAAGTSTAKTTWLDKDKSSSATNPIVLDSNGRAQIYGDGAYKLIIKTSDGSTLYTWDNIKIGVGGSWWYNLSDYVSFAAAITAIGSTSCDLILDINSTVSTAVTVPSTINIIPVKGKLLTKSTGGSITFNSTLQDVNFQWLSGFSAGDVTFAARSLIGVRPEWWGAKPDGATDCTAALVSAELSLPTGVDGGGEIVLSGGVYMATSWTPVRRNLNVRGQGHMATYLRCSATISTFVQIKNVGRYHFYDFAIDGNSNANTSLEIRAEISNSCAEHDFTHMRFTGAKVDSVVLADNGDASADDVSFINFFGCNFRSSAPSNSQFRNSAANGLVINIFGGNISSPSGSPYSIYADAGQITIYGAHLAGSTIAGIYAKNTQIQMYGGSSEDAALFLWTDTADIGTDVSARHIISGVQVRTTYGASVDGHTVCIRHEAARTLILTGCFLQQGVLYGTSGGSNNAFLIANGNSFAGSYTYYKHSSGYGQFWLLKSYAGISTPAIEGDISVRDIIQYGRMYKPSGPTTFANGDTTPDVSSGDFFVCSNTGSTTIINFDNGGEGQEITILFTNANTIITATAGNIVLDDSPWTSASGATRKFILRSNIWYKVPNL